MKAGEKAQKAHTEALAGLATAEDAKTRAEAAWLAKPDDATKAALHEARHAVADARLLVDAAASAVDQHRGEIEAAQQKAREERIAELQATVPSKYSTTEIAEASAALQTLMEIWSRSHARSAAASAAEREIASLGGPRGLYGEIGSSMRLALRGVLEGAAQASGAQPNTIQVWREALRHLNPMV